MKKALEPKEKNKESGEKQLTELIRQAGHEARIKKREVMTQHFNRLQEVIKKAVSRKQKSLRI